MNKTPVRRVVPTVNIFAIGFALGAAALSSAALFPVPSYAAETCHGQVATITPDANGVLTGTDGPDVIVTHGPFVDAKGGDDLVCAVDKADGVDAGAGDDLVDAGSAALGIYAVLGLGNDAFTGSPGDDVVTDGPQPSFPDEYAGQVDGTDVITTGDGDDAVRDNGRGFDQVNHDSIDTGAGDDHVSFGRIDPETVLETGTGDNSFGMLLFGTAADTWTVDVGARQVVIGDRTWAWTGNVRGFAFSPAFQQTLASLSFEGTAADEAFSIDGVGIDFPVTVHMGDGDDAIRVPSGTGAGSVYSGGGGRDSLAVNLYDGLGSDVAHRTALLDLTTHRLRWSRRTMVPDARLWGIEQFDIGGRRVRTVGGQGGQEITATGCRLDLHGGAGNDVLRAQFPGSSVCGKVARRFELLGGSGRDRLRGSQFADRLIGGRGHDVADGRGGIDTCQAEVRRSCERT